MIKGAIALLAFAASVPAQAAVVFETAGNISFFDTIVPLPKLSPGLYTVAVAFDAPVTVTSSYAGVNGQASYELVEGGGNELPLFWQFAQSDSTHISAAVNLQPDRVVGNHLFHPDKLQYAEIVAGGVTSPIGFRLTIDDGAAVSAVPESATWALMVIGFGLAGMGVRRRTVATA